jgi:hypothetical protein
MHTDLVVRRRALLVTYRRYLEADRAWDMAIRDVKSWFPPGNRPGPSTIGNPGSPIRRLYERRERALHQLKAARLKLEMARQRSVAKRRDEQVSRVVLLTRTLT